MAYRRPALIILAIMFMLSIIATAQTPFPTISTTPPCTTGAQQSCRIQGSDVPRNAARTCPYNGQPDTCLFEWDTNNQSMSRVLITRNANPGGTLQFVMRWVDDPNLVTHHQVVVNNLIPSGRYSFGFASCQVPAGSTIAESCNQVSPNWSAWNCGNILNSCSLSDSGYLVMPAPTANQPYPIWKTVAIGPSITYPGMWTSMNLQYNVTQLTSDAAGIMGFADLSIAPVASDGTVGTYVACPLPTLTVSADPPGAGIYKSGGDCGNNITAFLWNGGTTGVNNWPYPFRITLVDNYRTNDPNILNKHKTWDGKTPPYFLNQIGTLPWAASAFQGDTLNLLFWPQAGAAPGKYSAQVKITLLYNYNNNAAGTVGAGCNINVGATQTPPGVGDCYTHFTSGNSYTVTYQFQVLPTPAPITPPAYSTLSQPTPGMSAYKNLFQHSMAFDLAKECDDFRRWNLLGGWNNVGFGSSYFAAYTAPYAVSMYDGSRGRLQIHDYLRDNITADWQANTSYAWGDIIVHGGTYYQAGINSSGGVPTGFGTSGFNPPTTWSTSVATTTVDGQVTWVSMGTLTDWYNCAYQIEQQYDNWASVTPITAEWNEYTQGRLMHLYRQANTAPQDCLPNGPCVGIFTTVLKRFSDPPPNGVGQAISQMGNTVPYGTIRPGPYALIAVAMQWLATHQKPITMDTLLYTGIGQVEYMIHYTPYDAGAAFTVQYPPGPFEVACCAAIPIFDYGLVTEALILADLTYLAESDPNASTIHAVIHDVVKRTTEDQWKRYNVASQGWTYNPYQIVSSTTILPAQTLLNTLSAGAYAWLWRMEGDSCVLPNSTGGTDTCVAALDALVTSNMNMFVHGGTNAIVGAAYSKTNSQTYKWWDFWGWRAGTLSPLDSYVMPDRNPPEPLFADTLGPYHMVLGAGTVPIPSVTVAANGDATFKWYTFERLTNVAMGISPYYDNRGSVNGVVGAGIPVLWPIGVANPPAPTQPPTMYDPCPNGSSVFDNTKGFSVWVNTCTISGLANGTYYWGPQGTDAAGNVAKVPFQPQTALIALSGYPPPWVVNAAGVGQVCSGFGPCDACNWSTTTVPPGCTNTRWAQFTIPWTAPTGTFLISGSISGDPIGAGNIAVQLNGTKVDNITSSSPGTYSFTGLPSGVYVITPSASGFRFIPPSVGVAITTANSTAVSNNFVASQLANTYTIGGLVTLNTTPAPGIVLSLSGSSTSSTTTDSGGHYVFVVSPGTYTVTPVPVSGYTFTPTQITGISVVNANVLSQNFAATAVVPTTFTISGTISGAVQQGVLVNAGSYSGVSASDGTYVIANVPNGTYTVTPSLVGYDFTPDSLIVTVNNANVAGQNFVSAVLSLPAAQWNIGNIGPGPAARTAQPKKKKEPKK